MTTGPPLTWQQADDGQLRTWADAGTYCENLVLGGHDDWRLPRIDELLTVIDYSRWDPAIDPVFGDPSDFYWSDSIYYPYYPYYAWGVEYFYTAWTNQSDTRYGAWVRCVAGGPFWPFDPSDHLQANIDMVEDTLSVLSEITSHFLQNTRWLRKPYRGFNRVVPIAQFAVLCDVESFELAVRNL